MNEEFKDRRPIAFATMCADPIHHGHINLLKFAKNYGTVVVGLMTDESIKSYKNPDYNVSYDEVNNLSKSFDQSLFRGSNPMPLIKTTFLDLHSVYSFHPFKY